MNKFKFKLMLLGFPLAAGLVLAQRWGGRSQRDPWYPEFETCRTAREVPAHSTGTPTWTNEPGFDKDVFTFARVRYTRLGSAPWGAGYWWSDFPDSDLNLSFRCQQVTSMKVDPNGRVIDLPDKELFDYPWIYMVEPGRLRLTEQEVSILRKYLLNGGFLMLDDFWGESEWAGMAEEMKKVFPNRDFVDLPLDHPIYHCVFDIRAKGQIPSIQWWYRTGGSTFERADATVVHHRAIFDDKGRMMVIATHNTDNGDGWEREGENPEFFEKFSEKIAYPLGINIIFYQMTH